MLKKFLIHKEGKAPVGELLYNMENKEFQLNVYSHIDKNSTDVPAFIYFMMKDEMYTADHELAICFVRERLVPPDRANIAQILADLELPYYDEYLMLKCLNGRCVMDEFLVTLEEEYNSNNNLPLLNKAIESMK